MGALVPVRRACNFSPMLLVESFMVRSIPHIRKSWTRYWNSNWNVDRTLDWRRDFRVLVRQRIKTETELISAKFLRD